MDNAMVKRGIGAVVLAIIAALLLGYLLKDKSRERQEVVEMKLPGAPELSIPSLSDATSSVTDSAASLVGEATKTVSNAGTAVVASATGALTDLGSSTSNAVEAVTDSVSSTASTVTQTTENSVANVETASAGSANPGFSFRPPTKNEEQQINTPNSAASGDSTAKTATSTNDTVVASTPKVVAKKEVEKTFQPTIENEPKKEAKEKTVIKKAETKPKAKPVTASTSGGKYSIQLLATSSQSRANKLAKTMNGEGYVSFITQTTSNNKILYRVRVGGHKDRSAAISAQQTMKRRYQKNFFVQNSLVVSQ
ncbi:MAG: SPOR domain-containing protein [Cocleimonas sp.]